MVAALPGATEGERFGRRTWFVRGKGFAWERPFSKTDIRRFGDETPP
ncbi:MAG: MmcQ/YjbR family DNA-binding protein, partial [Acidimicrobiia bacterium]|nr:MmcQ/YjbR family DNA-binding protein [Acidimicrobiia bacterium]